MTEKLRRNRMNQRTAVLLVAAGICACFTGSSVFAESSIVEVGGNRIEVVSEGKVTVDVMKDVLPHPLTPYQYNNANLYRGDATVTYSMMGKEYCQGVVFDSFLNLWDAYYNLGAKCERVTFSTGHIDDGRQGNASLQIYFDGTLSQTIDLSPDMITRDVVLETSGVTQLLFKLEGQDVSYGLANASAYGYDYHNCKKEMTRMVSAVADGIYTHTCLDCGYVFEENVSSQTECKPYLMPYQSNTCYDPAFTDDLTDCVYVMGEAKYKGLVFDSYLDQRDALYNLGQAYKSVILTAGHIDNGRLGSGILRIYADGMQMKEVELAPGMINEQIIIDTTGVTQLKLVLEGTDVSYALSDLVFEPVTEHGHSFSSEVTLEASIGMTGICTYTCDYCGATYSEVIPALEG